VLSWFPWYFFRHRHIPFYECPYAVSAARGIVVYAADAASFFSYFGHSAAGSSRPQAAQAR
jgi:hypothetical protein